MSIPNYQEANAFLDTPSVAAILGLSPKTLENLRATRPQDGPPYVAIGRSIRYGRNALDQWIAARSVGGGL